MSDELGVGQRVRVLGTSRDDLNGKMGTIQTGLNEKGRHVVVLDPPGSTVSLKPANLEPDAFASSASTTQGAASSAFGAYVDKLKSVPPLVRERLEAAGYPGRLAPLAMAVPSVLLMLLWWAVGPLRTFALLVVVATLIHFEGPTLSRHRQPKAAAQALLASLSARVQRATGLSPQYSQYAVCGAVVAFLLLIVVRPMAVRPASPSFTNESATSSECAEAVETAYSQGFKDGASGAEWNPPYKEKGGGAKQDSGDAGKLEDDDLGSSYTPPPPSYSSSYTPSRRGSSSNGGGGVSQFINFGLLGYSVYQLGGQPWSMDMAMMNARQLPAWRLLMLGFLVARCVGFM